MLREPLKTLIFDNPPLRPSKGGELKGRFLEVPLNDRTDFIKDLKINSANLIDIILDVEVGLGIVIDNDSM